MQPQPQSPTASTTPPTPTSISPDASLSYLDIPDDSDEDDDQNYTVEHLHRMGSIQSEIEIQMKVRGNMRSMSDSSEFSMSNKEKELMLRQLCSLQSEDGSFLLDHSLAQVLGNQLQILLHLITATDIQRLDPNAILILYLDYLQGSRILRQLLHLLKPVIIFLHSLFLIDIFLI